MQTELSLLGVEGLDMLPKLRLNSPKMIVKRSSSSANFRKNLLRNNDDCFIVESKEVREIFRREPWLEKKERKEKKGLSLHKSYSDMFIVASKEPKKPQTASKPRQCRECFRLQHRCPECSMRLLLKKHLTGRTNQREFSDFLMRCSSETSSDYRRIFNKALEQVGKELNLSDGSEQKDVRSSGSITEQLAILNKNRTLLGGMKKQNVGIVNRAGRAIRRRSSCENLGKPQLSTSRQTVSRTGKSKDKPSEKTTMFVIDKNDPILKDLLVAKTDALCLDDKQFSGNVDPIKDPTKTLTQIDLGTAPLDNTRKTSGRNLTIQSFVIDITNEDRHMMLDAPSVHLLNETGDGRFSKRDIREENLEIDVNKLLVLGNLTENEIPRGVTDFDRVQHKFSDIDSMLQRMEFKLEADDGVAAKKKKSKTDVSCAIV